MADLAQDILRLQERLQELGRVLRLGEKRSTIEAQEQAMNAPDFWQDAEKARRISQEVSALKQPVDTWEAIRDELRDASEMTTLAAQEDNEEVLADVTKTLAGLEDRFRTLEVEALFSGQHDANNAIVNLHAGAGGTDAQDWTEMLTRMLLRYAEKKNWTVDILAESRGEEAGYKSIQFSVSGHNAYGHLRGEAGVHRLVRISPFDAEKMRHTAFALVEVIPELDEMSEKEFAIDEKDLRVDTFMSSGKGGQSVNTTYSAVRITHLPTSTVVTCQNERSQQQNKETAMRVLKSRLWALLQEEQKEKLEELKGGHKSPEWGNQIRSYVLHPYQMVKDHRSDYQTQDVNTVLDGDLDPFVEAYLRHVAKTQ